MLNLFAATWHLNYAKSAGMYLQEMLDLPFKYPNLHRWFVELGYFTIRRSDRLWVEQWLDLVIEQGMMRSIKDPGSLTRGRSFSEITRQEWIYTAHEFTAIHETITSTTSLQPSQSVKKSGKTLMGWNWIRPKLNEKMKALSMTNRLLSNQRFYLHHLQVRIIFLYFTFFWIDCISPL